MYCGACDSVSLHSFKHEYRDTPPLTPILSLLSAAPGSGGFFDLQLNSTTVDYEDLGHLVNVLSVALSDIDAYVAEERCTSQTPTSNAGEGPSTDLQMILKVLDAINSSIGTSTDIHLCLVHSDAPDFEIYSRLSCCPPRSFPSQSGDTTPHTSNLLPTTFGPWEGTTVAIRSILSYLKNLCLKARPAIYLPVFVMAAVL